MAGRGNKRELSAREIKTIKEMRSKNASWVSVGKALKIASKTLTKWLKEHPEVTAELAQLEEDRLKRVGALAQDSLELLLTKHKYKEVREVKKRLPKLVHDPVFDSETGEQLYDRKGAPRVSERHVTNERGVPQYEMVVVERITTDKVIMPNATITLFAKVNTDSNYTSINKADVNIVNKPEAKVNIMWKGTPGAKEVDRAASRDRD